MINQFGDAGPADPSAVAPPPEQAVEQVSWTGDQGDVTPTDDDVPVDDADLPDQDNTDLV